MNPIRSLSRLGATFLCLAALSALAIVDLTGCAGPAASSAPTASVPAATGNTGFTAFTNLFKSDATKANAWLQSQSGQDAITSLTGVATVVGALAGQPEVGVIAQDAGYALRLVETKALPSSAAIASTIQTLGGSASTAKLLAPVLSNAIASAVNDGGVSPKAATEVVAVQADAAAKSASQVNVQLSPELLRQFHLPAIDAIRPPEGRLAVAWL